MSIMIDEPMQAPAELYAPIERDRPSSLASAYLMPQLCVEESSYRWRGLAMAAIVVALFAFMVFRFWGAGDGGVDQNAYLVGGRLLAQHFSLRYTLPNPYAYTGGMFVRMPDGTYFPKYPFGLPLLYASFFWMFKVASVLPILKSHVNANQAVYWAFLVSPLSSVAAVAGMFFLARQVAGSFAAILAAILLGTSQLMLMLADNPNSHASCVAFIVWGMFFCVRWMQSGRYSHGIIGGLLVGYAATIRYSEILLFVAMCVVVISRLDWSQWKTWRSVSLAAAFATAAELLILQFDNPQNAMDGLEARWTLLHIHINVAIVIALLLYGVMALVFSVLYLKKSDWLLYARAVVPGLAWAVPVGTLLLVNHHTMGSFTGYDSTHESEFGAAFQWRFFWQNWEKAIRVFYDLGLFFIVPFAVAGIVMLFRRSWRVGLMLLAWLVPGVMLYMSYYWSPDRADAYARFFLTYLPALLVGAAVCFHDGLLRGRSESNQRGGIALTLAAGMVVAIASGVSAWRTVHGLRDGEEATKRPLHDFRERLSLAQTGQMLLANVPPNSVLFAENTGGVNTPSNYIQFVGDWELYGADTFSVDGSRRGFGGGNRPRNGRPNGNNGRPGGNRGGGPMFPPPNGGGVGGAQNDPAAVPTPVQPEQQEYHASLYRNKSARQLYQLEADVIAKALSQGRQVFLIVAKDHPNTDDISAGFAAALFGGAQAANGDPFLNFKDDLDEITKYKFKVVARWQDATLPPDSDEDASLTDNSPMGGGRGGGGGGMNMNRMFLGSDRVMDWELLEIKAPVGK